MDKRKTIYQAYKRFYGKEPNFNGENLMNLTIEIQSMAYILGKYDVFLGLGTNGFSYEYTNLDMPMCMEIQDIIVSELIGNKDNLEDDSVRFTEFAENTISTVGHAIRNILNDSPNQIETVRKLCNLLYVKEYVLPTSSDEVIMADTKCTREDLEAVEKLIGLIIQEQCKNNFDKSNIENVEKMMKMEKMATPYCVFIDESGNGKLPEITEGSGKKLAKSLIK